MSELVLIADDEADVRALVSGSLRQAGFSILEAADGPTALAMVRSQRPALLVLDLMLPGMSGFEICKALKTDPNTAAIPIIILSAKALETDRVTGLELGADDYVVKPFSPREMVLRVQSQIKKSLPIPLSADSLRVGDLSLDCTRATARFRGTSYSLEVLEVRLLAALMERPGRVQKTEFLLDAVWGEGTMVGERTLAAHVQRLREKLGSGADCLVTAPGVGYGITAAQA